MAYVAGYQRSPQSLRPNAGVMVRTKQKGHCHSESLENLLRIHNFIAIHNL